MWQWWTLQYGCYCHSLICRVSNCCLSLYLHVAGDYNRVPENTFGVLENLNLFWARQWEPCNEVTLVSRCVSGVNWCLVSRQSVSSVSWVHWTLTGTKYTWVRWVCLVTLVPCLKPNLYRKPVSKVSYCRYLALALCCIVMLQHWNLLCAILFIIAFLWFVYFYLQFICLFIFSRYSYNRRRCLFLFRVCLCSLLHI